MEFEVRWKGRGVFTVVAEVWRGRGVSEGRREKGEGENGHVT